MVTLKYWPKVDILAGWEVVKRKLRMRSRNSNEVLFFGPDDSSRGCRARTIYRGFGRVCSQAPRDFSGFLVDLGAVELTNFSYQLPMAPSRGFNCLRQARIHIPIPGQNVRRLSDFVRAVADPTNKYQVYTSRSPNPYLNLSIEHYILQKSAPDSTILFLYTNRPSVIIGRNQNPWTEVNLGLLRNDQEILPDSEHRVQLVRRRSGGGTVFHDEGNVNYSVIMPTAEFDRDKHAEMVARALQNLGVEKVRVNERHDIVLDKMVLGEGERPFKISGSAYKLTRLRSVHHGTCLVSSPNIRSISKYLRAPGKPFIKAKGVESVSSRIANVGITNAKFEGAVKHEFWKMYNHSKAISVGRAEMEVPEIKRGLEELMVAG